MARADLLLTRNSDVLTGIPSKILGKGSERAGCLRRGNGSAHTYGVPTKW